MWVRHVDRGVAALARAHPDETFYALAFHGGYAERGRRIDGPIVGANSEEGFREMHAEPDLERGFDGVRWHPPDWRYEQLDLPGAATANIRMYRRLNAIGRDGSLAAWDRLFARHERAIVDAARELARRARAGDGGFGKLRRASDFVVFCYDGSRDGAAVARKTIPAKVFARLFPEQAPRAKARADLERLPPDALARHAISRFGVFEPPMTSEEAVDALVRLGAAAVPALIEALDHPERGGKAAMTLARIGAPAAASAADALLAQVRRGTDASMWSANALGALGRLDDLAALTARANTRDDAIRGLARGRPRSYAHLTALLDRKDRAITKAIADALRPGSAAYAASPDDLPLLLDTARSKHAVLRRDVACALSNDALERVRARAAACLTALLDDRDAEVRRLAEVNLGFLGKAGRVSGR